MVGKAPAIAVNASRMPSWIPKFTIEAPTVLRGNTSRGRYTFLTSPEFATIEPVPPVTISLKIVPTVSPAKM